MAMLTDTARFRETDPEPLVTAALACPLCLRGESVQWSADVHGHDPSVSCRCARCDVSWRLYLAPQQALRFGLTARGGADVPG